MNVDRVQNDPGRDSGIYLEIDPQGPNLEPPSGQSFFPPADKGAGDSGKTSRVPRKGTPARSRTDRSGNGTNSDQQIGSGTSV